jgi:hypothetical protein
MRGKLQYLNRNPIVLTAPCFCLLVLNLAIGNQWDWVGDGLFLTLFALSLVKMIQRHRQGLEWVEGVH